MDGTYNPPGFDLGRPIGSAGAGSGAEVSQAGHGEVQALANPGSREEKEAERSLVQRALGDDVERVRVHVSLVARGSMFTPAEERLAAQSKDH
jgi:hypothetical protein